MSLNVIERLSFKTLLQTSMIWKKVAPMVITWFRGKPLDKSTARRLYSSTLRRVSCNPSNYSELSSRTYMNNRRTWLQGWKTTAFFNRTTKQVKPINDHNIVPDNLYLIPNYRQYTRRSTEILCHTIQCVRSVGEITWTGARFVQNGHLRTVS